MTHKRKRKDKKKLEKKKKEKKPFNMLEAFRIPTLGKNDEMKVKELFGLSNTVGALKKKYADTEFQIKMSYTFIEKLKKGKVKGPLMFKVSDNLFMPMHDIKEIIKGIEKDIKTLKDSNVITRGQLEHRYDEYIDSMIRLYRYLKEKVGDKELSTISGHRGVDPKSIDEQKIIFEKEITEEMQKAGVDLDKEVKEAIQKDKEKKKGAE